MSYPVSVCGLIASPDIDYHAWQTAFYHQDLATIDAGVAARFVELDIDREALALGCTADLLVATLHPGHIGCCPGIDYADQEVIEEVERYSYPVESTYTVCGIFADNGQCYSGLWVGHGPALAYAAAYHHFDRQRRHLLVAALHEGIVERTPETPTWADPACNSEAEMRSRLTELMRKP